MSAWRKVAFAGIVCAPAVLIVGSLAIAVETGTGSVPAPRARHEIVLAQDTAATPPPAAGVSAEDAEKVSPEVAAEALPVFTEEYLKDSANIAAGKEVWDSTCTGCHGARAYPGKAPKLKPKKYTPDFVFHQATFGGKKMPPFGDVFTYEERMAVVAWVLSHNFAP